MGKQIKVKALRRKNTANKAKNRKMVEANGKLLKELKKSFKS